MRRNSGGYGGLLHWFFRLFEKRRCQASTGPPNRGKPSLTLGTLGGPLGLLLGGAYGALLGSLFDLGTAEEAESVLATMARAIQPSTTALIAEITEPAVEVVDTEMERLPSLYRS